MRPTRARTRLVAVVVMSALALTLAGCGGRAAQGMRGDAARRLQVSGSSTLGPLVAEIANRHEDVGGTVRVDVQTGGSAAGLNQVVQGTADIGMVTAPLYEGMDGVQPHVVAVDGVAPVVHAEGPVQVDGFTREELVEIFTGGAASGTPPGLAEGQSYVVVGKAAGRGTLQVFAEYLGVPPEAQVADVEVGDNSQVIRMVSQEKSAIGYVSIGVALLAIEDGAPVRVLSVDGVEPSAEHVRDGLFPITRRLELVTRGDPDADVLSFIDYVRSEEHEDLYRQFGFVRVPSP